MFGLADLAAAS